jgi:hypothetical protein
MCGLERVSSGDTINCFIIAGKLNVAFIHPVRLLFSFLFYTEAYFHSVPRIPSTNQLLTFNASSVGETENTVVVNFFSSVGSS